MQRVFSAKMAATGDHAYSAEKAGYAVPVNAGAGLMRNPDVAEDVRRRARHKLQTVGAQVSVDVLVEIALDTKQKASSRVAAAGKLGMMSGVATVRELSPEDLAEMPADQIRALLGEAQRAYEARMAQLRTIEHEPIDPETPDCAQPAPNVFE